MENIMCGFIKCYRTPPIIIEILESRRLKNFLFMFCCMTFPLMTSAQAAGGQIRRKESKVKVTKFKRLPTKRIEISNTKEYYEYNYSSLTVLPHLPNGQTIGEYIEKHTVFPPIKYHLEKIVINIDFIVLSNGEICCIEAESVGQYADDAFRRQALLAINDMPQLIPGERQGKKVATKIRGRIVFWAESGKSKGVTFNWN